MSARIAYFDCLSGISGDMALAALLDCGADEQALREGLARLGVGGWELAVSRTEQNGIGAADVTVTQTEVLEHGRHLSDIEAILREAAVSDVVRERSLAVFRRLAEAEAKVHQTSPERIHFHEVGAIDAIVDIVGVCLLLDQLGIEEVRCSPLPMGYGFVKCAHGVIPLPAPAVMELCKGCPVRSVDVEGELVTPTGAALATTLAAEFGGMPQMTVRETGYGAGKKRFGDRPNLLRVVVGEVETCASSGLSEVVAIETNLDDFLPQLVAPLSDRLFAAGALDVFTAPIQMKKGRPALLLTVLCAPGDVEKLSGVLFRETTTLGVRLSTHRRLCLERSWRAVRTDYGTIRVKTGVWKGEVVTASPEFEDVRAAAEQAGTPMKEVRLAAERAFAEGAFADEPGN